MSVDGEVKSQYLSGHLRPVESETTFFDLEVRGKIPDELNGRYLRIGPNPVGDIDPANYHWFLGDGMVHGIRLSGGRASWYRNRFVRSTHVSKSLGEEPAPGQRHAGMDTVNTSLMAVAGKTYALVEAGARPVELDYELNTVCHADFGGGLPNGFTAHPKYDPVTKETHGVCYFWALGHLQHVVINCDGVVTRVDPVELESPVVGGPMVHDTALTTNFVVILDLPVVFDLSIIERGGNFPYGWSESYGARVGLKPRNSAGPTRWFEVDPMYIFHTLGAWEEGDASDPDAVVMVYSELARVFSQDELGPSEGDGRLCSLRFDLRSGRVAHTVHSEKGSEFPRIDDRMIGRRPELGVTVGLPLFGEGVRSNSIFTHAIDERGDISTSEFLSGPNHLAGEMCVVGRCDGLGGSSWLMGFVYDIEADSTEFRIYDSGDPSEPVASVRTPRRVPMGFHGSFIADDLVAPS